MLLLHEAAFDVGSFHRLKRIVIFTQADDFNCTLDNVFLRQLATFDDLRNTTLIIFIT